MPARPTALLCLIITLILSPWIRAETYLLSVVPQFTPVDIGLRWSPLLQRLEKDTGIHLQLRVTESIPKFEAELLEGIPDFTYLNPYHMVMAKKARGYLPMARSAHPLRGVLVVDRQGPITRVTDLAGKTLAFPAPNAFGASLYPRALLREKEGIAFTPVYVGSHQNAYRHVLLGEAAGAGGVESSLNREPPAVRDRLRVLYTTPPTAAHPLAAHPRVPAAVRDRFQRALLALNRTEEGRRLLADTDLAEARPADYARDYLPLERLKLDKSVVTP